MHGATPDHYLQLTTDRLLDHNILHHPPTQVPIWLAATMLWAWNNSRNGRHVRDLHRRLAFVPLLGLVPHA